MLKHSGVCILNVLLCGQLFAAPYLAAPNCALAAGNEALASGTVETPPSHNKVGALTEQALKEEIELERLNTVFHLKTTYVSPWRQRRMFAYAQTGAWATEVGQIEQISIRYTLANRKKPRPRPGVEPDTEGDAGEEVPVEPNLETAVEAHPIGELQQTCLANTPSATAAPSSASLSVNTNAGSSSTSITPARANVAQISTRNLSAATTPRRTKTRGKLAASAETQLVGQSIGALGDITEVALNFVNYLKLHHNNLTPALYRKNVQQLRGQIESVLSERAAMVERLRSSDDYESLMAEGRLLADIKDLLLLEYREFHSGTKRFWIFQNTAYGVDLAKNSLAMAGSITSIEANHLKRARMAGGAGLYSLLTGVIVLITPAVGRVTGNLSGLAARRSISKELLDVEEKDVDILAKDHQRLVSLSKRQTGSSLLPQAEPSDSNRTGLTARLPIYSGIEQLFREAAKTQESQRRRANSTLKENVLFAGLVGGPRLTNGILQVIGSWEFFSNPPLANKLFAAGCTTYAAGTALNILETTRLQTAFELRRRRQIQTGTTPLAQFDKRLATLQQLEAKIGH